MRNFLTILLFLVGSLSVKAQDSYGHYVNYYSIEGGFIGSSGGLGIGPTFSYYRGGHKIDAGLNIKIYDVWKDGPGIMGTYLGYKFYPNERKNDFNLYFGYNNLFGAHDRGKKYPKVYDEVSDTYRSPKHVFLLENLVGIGFDYQMGNRFYMLTDFSVGVVLDWSTFSDSDTQFEVRSTGLIRIGMGYNIAWRKAK